MLGKRCVTGDAGLRGSLERRAFQPIREEISKGRYKSKALANFLDRGGTRLDHLLDGVGSGVTLGLDAYCTGARCFRNAGGM